MCAIRAASVSYLHFTRTDVTRIYDRKDPIFQVLGALKKKELWDTDAKLIYGRVQGKVNKHKRDLDGDVLKYPDDEENEYEDETRCLKVFAAYLSEDELGTWKQLDGPVRGLLGRYFGVIPCQLDIMSAGEMRLSEGVQAGKAFRR